MIIRILNKKGNIEKMLQSCKKVMKRVLSVIEIITIFSAAAGLCAGIIQSKEKNTGHRTYGIYERVFKRIFDVFFSTLALLLFSPVLLILSIFVLINMGTPVLFKQVRPGRNEKPFALYKFRTMSNKRDENGDLLPDDLRITRFGRFLRSTSLDELPELLAIIRGEMSIVGPRPLLMEYLPYYTEEEHQRHDVRPGLTGWAQVNGRNNINSWEERFRYDLEYVNHISFVMDLKIILLTVYKVLKRSDIQVGSEIKAGRLDVVRSENRNKKI